MGDQEGCILVENSMEDQFTDRFKLLGLANAYEETKKTSQIIIQSFEFSADRKKKQILHTLKVAIGDLTNYVDFQKFLISL